MREEMNSLVNELKEYASGLIADDNADIANVGHGLEAILRGDPR